MQNNVLTPPPFWSLDLVFSQFVKLFNFQISKLKEASAYPGVYVLYGHPLQKVNVMGYIVSKEEKEEFCEFKVDDGTEILAVVCWKEQNSTEDYDDIILGTLVNVYGRLQQFRGEIQVIATCLNKEEDPNAEMLFWLDVMALQETYKQPFVEPDPDVFMQS